MSDDLLTESEFRARFPQASDMVVRRSSRPDPKWPEKLRGGPAVESERELHDDIEAHCIRQNYLYIHARMDVPSTIQVGTPDFTIFLPGGIALFLECKARGTKTTTEQLGKIAHARKLGFAAEVVDNMEDALHAMGQARDWKCQ